MTAARERAVYALARELGVTAEVAQAAVYMLEREDLRICGTCSTCAHRENACDFEFDPEVADESGCTEWWVKP